MRKLVGYTLLGIAAYLVAKIIWDFLGHLSERP